VADEGAAGALEGVVDGVVGEDREPVSSAANAAAAGGVGNDGAWVVRASEEAAGGAVGVDVRSGSRVPGEGVNGGVSEDGEPASSVLEAGEEGERVSRARDVRTQPVSSDIRADVLPRLNKKRRSCTIRLSCELR